MFSSIAETCVFIIYSISVRLRAVSSSETLSISSATYPLISSEILSIVSLFKGFKTWVSLTSLTFIIFCSRFCLTGDKLGDFFGGLPTGVVDHEESLLFAFAEVVLNEHLNVLDGLPLFERLAFKKASFDFTLIADFSIWSRCEIRPCSRSSKSTEWPSKNASLFFEDMKLKSTPDLARAKRIFKLMKLVISFWSFMSISSRAYIDFWAMISSLWLSCWTRLYQITLLVDSSI